MDYMVDNKVNRFPFASNSLFRLTTCERKAFKLLFEQIVNHKQIFKERFGGNHQSIISFAIFGFDYCMKKQQNKILK